MSRENPSAPHDGFCIYIDTFCQGPVPVVSDENGYIIFATELEARREIANHQVKRLQLSSTASANTKTRWRWKNTLFP